MHGGISPAQLLTIVALGGGVLVAVLLPVVTVVLLLAMPKRHPRSRQPTEPEEPAGAAGISGRPAPPAGPAGRELSVGVGRGATERCAMSVLGPLIGLSVAGGILVLLAMPVVAVVSFLRNRPPPGPLPERRGFPVVVADPPDGPADRQ